MRGIAAAALIALGVAFAPAVAEAHLVVTGIGPVYDGVTHFALSPEEFLPVLALAGFAGLRGPRAARLSLAALAVAWLGGGLFASAFGLAPPALWIRLATAVVLFVSGGMLAANLSLPGSACALAAGLLGLLRGVADAGPVVDGGEGLSLLGMAAAAAALFALAASATLPLRRLWMIVAARVVGSWIAAVGLLLAGWIVRFGAGVA